MSDFLKKRRPRMTDEEERALWERVRTMPSEVGGAARRRSPWAALWARPSVRFGAPVLAVALVAVVWVAQRAPEAPRPESAIGTVGTAETEQRADLPVAAPQEASEAPAAGSAPAPAPTVGQDARMRMPAAASVAEEDAVQPAAPRRAIANRADDVGAAQTQSQSKEKTTFAAPPPAASTAPAPPPPAPAPAEKKAEGARVLAGSSAPSSPEAARDEAATGAADLQAYRAMPESGTDVTNRVTAVAAAWGDPAVARTLQSRILRDVLRRETEGAFVGTYRLPFSGEAVRFEGSPESDVVPATSPRERRAVLAMELARAIARGDRDLVVRVTDAATRLATQNPGDAGARALVEWSIATTRAMKSK